MIKAAEESLQEAGVKEKIRVGLADAGYCSEENLKRKQPEGLELMVATKKDCLSATGREAKKNNEGAPPAARADSKGSFRTGTNGKETVDQTGTSVV